MQHHAFKTKHRYRQNDVDGIVFGPVVGLVNRCHTARNGALKVGV